MKYFERLPTKIGFIFATLFCLIYFNNDYLSYRPVSCMVLDKVESSGRNSGDFYLVLKENEYVFDLNVSPATYSQSKVGSTLTFKLREMDYKQTARNNTIFFFGQIIVFAIALACLFGGFVDLTFNT